MHPRALLALLTAAVTVLGVLVVLTFAQAATSTTDEQALTAGSRYRGAARDGGTTPPTSPEFRLRDQDGQVQTLRRNRAAATIVTFLFTTCEDTCPAMARQVSGALDQLGGRVPTLVVSVDPKADTPHSAQRFLNTMGLRGRASYLLGSRAQLSPVWLAYGIQPQGAAFDHSAYVLVLDDQGRQRVAWPADKLTSEGLAHDVRVVQRLSSAATPAPTDGPRG